MGAAHKLVDKELFRSLVPLNALSDTHFNELIKKAKIEELSSGYYLFKTGDRDNQTVYLLDGEVALLQGRKEKSLIFSGTEEALHPLASQQPRQFTARTKGRVTVMRIDSGLLDVMLTWDQSSGSCYEVNDLHSEEDEDWMTRMLQSELMHKLPAQNLQQLIMRMEELEAKSGDTVVHQDEKGDFYYIIKQGTCVVARKLSERGKPIKLAELNEGDSFGEEALLSGGKRNASIIMKTDGVLMRLAKKDFDELLKDPLVMQVTYKEGCKVVEDVGVWLDVRLPGEYENGHIPGSINIPLAAIRDETDKLNTDAKYIVYCDTGRRSSSAIFLLGQDGFDGCVLKNGLASVPHDDLEIITATDNKNPRMSDASVANVDVIPFNQARSKIDPRIKDQTPAENKKSPDENQQRIIRILQDQLDTLKLELLKKKKKFQYYVQTQKKIFSIRMKWRA